MGALYEVVPLLNSTFIGVEGVVANVTGKVLWLLAMATGKLAAVAITNFNPDKDPENRTLNIVQELIQVLET